MTTERSLTIKNKTRSQVILNLPASAVPEMSARAPARPGGALPRARRVGGGIVPAATPNRGSLPTPRNVGGSITLNARGTEGDEVGGLPTSVKRAPEVQAALKAGKIRVEVVLKGEGARPAAPPARPRPLGPNATTQPARPAPGRRADP